MPFSDSCPKKWGNIGGNFIHRWGNLAGGNRIVEHQVGQLPMALTDTKIRNAKPGERLRKLYDGEGLYLEITPSGSRRWRFRYRRPVTGKENRLSFGLYPGVSLKEARSKRDEARKLLAGTASTRGRSGARSRNRRGNWRRIPSRRWRGSGSSTT